MTDGVAALDESKAEITIHFKPSANAYIFGNQAPNKLTIRVQPDEAVFLKVNSCVPSLETTVEAIDLDLSYHGREIPEAYEALLLDALKGDFTRSVRNDELDESWRIFTPLLHYLDKNEDVVPRQYAYGPSIPMDLLKLVLTSAGSNGPDGLDEFVSSYQKHSKPG